MTFVNGGDNIGVYVPLFASLPQSELVTVVAVFLTMTGIWCGLSHTLVRHPLAGRPLRRYGQRIAPFVLILLGLTILCELTLA